MNKDLSVIYAIISAFFSFAFGVEMGVVFGALAGAFLSVRFCKTKTAQAQLIHVIFSAILSCMIIGGTSTIYPSWISLNVVGLIYGFLILLLAEKVYVALDALNLTEKINTIIDRVIKKWLP